MPSLLVLGAASPGGSELRAVGVPVVLSPAAAGTWLGNVALVSSRGSNPAGHGRQTWIPQGTEASDQGCCWPSFLPWALPTRWPLEAEPEQLRPLVPWERDRQGGRSVSFPFALGTVYLGGVLCQKGVLKVTSAGPRLSRAVGCMDERLNPAHRGVCGPGFGSMTFMSCCWSAICSGHHCLLLKLFLGVSRGHVQVVTRAGSSWGRPALLGQLLPAAGSELHDPGAGPLRPLAPSASSHGKHALCMHVGGGVMGRKSGREPRVLNTY